MAFWRSQGPADSDAVRALQALCPVQYMKHSCRTTEERHFDLLVGVSLVIGFEAC